MGHLRTQASNLEPEAQKNWNTLATRSGKADRNPSVLLPCTRPPARVDAAPHQDGGRSDAQGPRGPAPEKHRHQQATRAAIDYAEDYDDTVAELKREQHEPLGMIDVVKNMFMWTESPHERLNQKKSLRTD
jgi:hypothetical protein